MTEESKTEIAAIAAAPATVVKEAIEVASDAVKAAAKAVAETKSVKVAKASAKRAKRVAKTVKTPIAKAARKAARRPAVRKITRAVRKPAAAAKQGFETMTKTNNKFFAFDTIPAFAPFQSMFDQGNERGKDFVKKGQKVAEEMADLTRANVEAIVEAGKIAVEGTKAIGQDFVAKGRDRVEQASDAIRSLAEAKSPTEYMQLQGEFARAQFDRFVTDSSKLTETMVKLAGEAFQPLQNRAAANAQRFNTLVA